MDKKVIQSINSVITEMMDKVMKKFHAEKPLYATLVPDEIFKGSHFERRFTTPFGNAWEKLAVAVSKAYHGHCEQGATVEGTVGEESLRSKECTEYILRF